MTERKRADETPHEDRKFAETLIEHSAVATFVLDTDHRVVIWNRACTELTGFPASQMIGTDNQWKPFYERKRPCLADIVLEADFSGLPDLYPMYGKSALSPSALYAEGWYQNLNGKDRFILFDSGPVYGSKGELIAAIETLQDITERKLAEEALRESEETYRSILTASPDDITITDLEGRLLMVSPAAYTIFGYERGYTFQNLRIYDFIVPEDLERARSNIMQMFQGDYQGPNEYHGVRKDRSIIDIEVNSELIRGADGQPTKIVFIVRDITERKRFELALKKSEEKYRFIVDNLKEVVFRTDAEGHWLFLNPAWTEVTGFDVQESLNKVFLNYVHPEDRQRNLELFKPLIERLKHDCRHEIRYLHKNGGFRWIEVWARLTLDENNNATGTAGTLTDITARKRAEGKFSQLATEQQTILDTVTMGISFVRDRKIQWNNAAYDRIFGYEPGETRGQETAVFYVNSADYERVGTEGYAHLATSGGYATEVEMKRKDGSHFWCSLAGKAVNPMNLADGSIWIQQDITERWQAAEALRQSEEFIRSVLDSVDEGFLVVDREHRIVTANKAYCSWVDTNLAGIIGRPCFEVSHRSPRPCYEQDEDCAVKRTFETGEPHVSVYKHKDAKGNMLYIETKAFPLKNAAGKVTSAIETLHNITERHLLEAEQLKTQKLEAIGTLAGGIAHDFNNLLQGVFGYLSMARMNISSREKALSMLEQAEKALNMSVNLTTQLLTFSKGGKPIKKKIALRSLIENSVKFALSGSRSDYRINLDDNLWPVEADEGQIGQVIQNITLNADQAMPMGGTIAIKATNIAKNLEGCSASKPSLMTDRWVEIIISDNGIGITTEHLSRIFDPYYTTKQKGSGLGLATTYSIIKNHGGTIEVESELNKGTTFTIHLPASEPELSAVPPAKTPADMRKSRILVMDDEAVVRNVVGEMLQNMGHEVEVVTDGEAAIKKYQSARATGSPFDVVILNVTIRGGMGGEETIKRLREFDPAVVAIVSSGYSDEAVVSNYTAHGFKAVLPKPFNLTRLQAALGAVLKSY